MRKRLLCLATFGLLALLSGTGFSLPTCYDCFNLHCHSSLSYDFGYCESISGGCIAWGTCDFS